MFLNSHIKFNKLNDTLLIILNVTFIMYEHSYG